jgi:CO/xanthine dehydrogenase FAD-binding subunit
MRFEKLVKPGDLELAGQILKDDPDSVILGGTTFLRISDKKYSTAIDLSDLSLDYIKDNKTQIEIGSYTTLREIETSPTINKYWGNLLPRSLKNLVGIQFRNNATIGGAICCRLGFSEIITALLVLECELVFKEIGTVSLLDYISNRNIKHDILKKIILQKREGKSSYQAMRNSSTDLPILSVAISDYDEISIAVGARPAIAGVSEKASRLINSDRSKIAETAELIAEEFNFGNDLRSSSEYRKKIASVLVKHALTEVLS